MLEQEAMRIIMEGLVEDDGKTRKQIAEEKRSNKERAITMLRRKIKINDTFAAILAMSGMVIALIEYDFYHDGDDTFVRPTKDVWQVLTESSQTTDPYSAFTLRNYNVSTPFTTTLRSIVTISTAVLMVPLFFHMLLNYRLSVLSGKTPVEHGLLRTRYFRTFLIEVVINSIHCPPFFDTTFTMTQINFPLTYSLDLILSNLMLLRIYLGFRLFAHYSKWRSELSMKYCELEGCEASTVFAMKASLKESPYLSLLIAFMASAVVLGVPVKNFEQPLNEYLL